MPWQNPLLSDPSGAAFLQQQQNSTPVPQALIDQIRPATASRAGRLGIPDVAGELPAEVGQPTPAGPAPSAAQGGGQIPAGRLANSPLMTDAAGNPISAAQPMSASELMQLNPSNMSSWTLGNQLQAAQLAAGGYNGFMHTANPSSPEAQALALRQLHQNSLGQQTEGRLSDALRGFTGQNGQFIQGSAQLGNRAQQLAEDQHSFNSSQVVANETAYRNWLAQRSANGQPPPTEEEARQFRALLPAASPPGAVPTGAAPPGGTPMSMPGGATAPTGPGFNVPTPAGTTPVTHPWSSIANQLETTYRAAQTQAGIQRGGPVTPEQMNQQITNFVLSLQNNGVQLTPENSMAIRQYMSEKFGLPNVEQWWNTRDSVLPDIGLGRESTDAMARRTLRQSAGVGASNSNSGTPLLMRLLNFGRGGLFPNGQYQ